MERQIGEQFDFLGVKLEVIEGEKDSCEGCYLCDETLCGCNIIINFIGSCASSEREDGRDIIFKEVQP